MSSGLANIDLVEILFTGFWIFFIGLVLYLHRESKREGYPLVSDRSDSITVQGFPSMPPPKTYRLEGGRTVTAPSYAGADTDFHAKPAAAYPGAPLDPTGDPLLARFGPGSWAKRPDIFETTLEGKPRIVPLRAADGFHVDAKDTDPRGLPVIAADGKKVGEVSDVWIDLAEPQIYFLEVATPGGSKMVPFGFADMSSGSIKVNALYSHQWANVPEIASPNQITMLEEDKIMGYFGGGLMFADDQRGEPLY